MKYLLVTGIYPPEVGGPATVIAGLRSDLLTKGYEVEVVTYGDCPSECGIARVSRVGNVVKRYFSMMWEVRRRLKDDVVVFATDVFSVGIPVRMAITGRRNRFLLRLGGEWCWEDAVNRGERITLRQYWNQAETLRRKLMRWNYGWILKRAKRIIVTSDLLKEIVVRITPSITERIVTIPNGFPATPKHQTQSSPNGSLRLSYVGRFAPVKNMGFFARVLKRLHEDGASIQAVLAGDGPEWEQVRSALVTVPEVRLPGRVSLDEGMKLLCESDLHILPSLSDICPNSVAEALACGVPCVITSEHGLPKPLSGVIELDPQNESVWVKTLTELSYDRSRLDVLRKECLPIQGQESLVDAILNV